MWVESGWKCRYNIVKNRNHGKEILDMDTPDMLKMAIERQAEAVPRGALLKAAEHISEKYRKEFGQGKRLVWEPVDILAYAIVRMPATFAALAAAMQYAKERYQGEIQSVLDVGSGTGACAWAVFSLFDEVQEMVCVEREASMRQCGQKLMEQAEFRDKVTWVPGDMQELRLDRKYDLVVASYSLNELPEKTRLEVVRNLWEHTNKLLLIVEPGTPAACAQMVRTREFLLGQGGSMAAPCAHGGACMLGKDDWCHFVARVQRSRLHKLLKGGDVPYEDEKFSYVAVAKEPVAALDGGRVLRHPMVESGRVGLKLCTAEGIVERTVTKKEKEAFKRARKVKWGERV